MSDLEKSCPEQIPESLPGELSAGLRRRRARFGPLGFCRGEAGRLQAGRLQAAGLVCLTLLGCNGGAVSMSKAWGKSQSTVTGEAVAAAEQAGSSKDEAAAEQEAGAAAEASPKFIEAVVMYAGGRYERSATLLELHLLRHPTHYHGRVLLARALMYSGRAGEAVLVLQSAPGSTAAAGGDVAAARALQGGSAGGAVTRTAVSGPDAERLLAEALLLDGRFSEAEPILLSALERNSEDPRLLLLLARVYRNAGRGEQAATLYRQALMYRSELGVAARELSQVYAARGAFAAAEEWQQHAAHLLPEALQIPQGLRAPAEAQR